MIAPYRKFVVAIIGAAAAGLAAFGVVDLGDDAVDGIVSTVIALLTAFGVWAAPNTPS